MKSAATGDVERPGAVRSRAARVVRWRTDGSVWLLSALMVGTAGALLVTQVPEGWQVPSWQVWVALLVLFAVAEVLVVHIPTKASSHSQSLREIPAVLALAVLGPPAYVTAFVIGTGLAVLLWWRQQGVKAVFNIAMFALEATVGVVVYRAVLGSGDPTYPLGWLSALVAVIGMNLVSGTVVTAAISLTEARLETAVLRDVLRSGLLAALINVSLALLVTVVLLERPYAFPLLLVTFGLVAFAYRMYLSIARGYDQLQSLYRFLGSTGRPSELADVATVLTREAKTLLGAETGELVLVPTGGRGGWHYRHHANGAEEAVQLQPGMPVADGEWWQDALAGRRVLRASPSKGPIGRTGGRAPVGRPRDGIAIPVGAAGLVEAVLIVTDRSFDKETFGQQDVDLLQTLAAHAAVALDKANLVDRLRRVADEREHEARHDALTGLPNRRAFTEAVEEALVSGVEGTVLLMDLDDFKDVNDTLGHAAGDQLLQVTGHRLLVTRTQGGPPVDVACVARLGGDEFAVLLPGASTEQAVAHARALLVALTEPVPLHDITLTTTLSIGVAPLPPGGEEGDVLAHADTAMYAAKSARSGVEVYQAEETDAIHRRLALAGDLPGAIDHHCFEVWCQPQADALTGEVVAFEALLRWDHPLYGQVPPPEVIAVAESTGQLRRLTDAVMRDALGQRQAWSAAGRPLGVSINVTPRDLADVTLPTTVAGLLEDTGTPASALTLEITESGVMNDPERCMAVLEALNALGVKISVDDFGTGHSSLSYLEQLPVHEVKIDRSFVQRLAREANDSIVVRATIALAHDLGLTVVAEGVETTVARHRVAELGCELLQGFDLARPMPPGAVVGWLESHGPAHALS